MADAKIVPHKVAMSRALGAAFLSHKVEQLEKSVHTGGNWRERRTVDNRSSGGETKRMTIKKRSDEGVGDGTDQMEGQRDEGEHDRRSEDGHGNKDADVIVVDASVLVNAITHLKKWCREGREEIVIVPLEALNTLDLLKKGNSALAQRARAASRVLEAQVGTNPRIRVQQDDAFVLWDNIPFDNPMPQNSSSPEWVRRTICCARWEVEHAATELDAEKRRVVLAVQSPSPDTQSESLKAAPISTSPVPLPAPHSNRYENRLSGALVATWAANAGVEVLEVTSNPPQTHSGNASTDITIKGRRSADGGRRSGEEERSWRTPGGRGRRNSRGAAHVHKLPPMATGTGLVERPQAVMTMMEMVTQPNRVVRVLARGEKLDP